MRSLFALLVGFSLLVAPSAAATDASNVAQSDESTTTIGAPNVADEPLPDDDEGGGGSTWLLVLMAIIVAAMVVVAAAFARGRRPPE